MIITIGRQHGSSGREIARLLAEKLNYKCYDKLQITPTSAETSLTPSMKSACPHLSSTQAATV